MLSHGSDQPSADHQEAEHDRNLKHAPEGSSNRQDESIVNIPPTCTASTSPNNLHSTKNLSSAQRSLPKGIEKVISISNRKSDMPATSDATCGRHFKERISRFTDTSLSNLDPYLVPYLKSLQSKSSSSSKPPVSVDNHPNKHDLDIEFLRPNDVRATYVCRKKKTNVDKDGGDTNGRKTASGEPGTIPDYLIHAGIQHLNLSSSDGKVVIPRGVLVRLIEQTINLSGAAVCGDDVVIERYSPTWHRFARLLRTSDLHKISTSTEVLNPADSTHNGDSKQPDMQDTTYQGPNGNTTRVIPPPLQPKDEPTTSTNTIVEHEYVILALDTRKKRVITTRFRRLLDGSSTVPLPSSESLLKVEHLNKYLHFSRLGLTIA